MEVWGQKTLTQAGELTKNWYANAWKLGHKQHPRQLHVKLNDER
jgi:hypothetical protein